MPLPSIHLRATACAIGLVLLSFASWADADPPSRVARLGFMSGAVSFSPAGESDWVQAAFNRPLVGGDRLWTDANGRAEIQVGAAMIRMNADTGVSVLNLDDRTAQLQLTEGALNVRVRALASGQVVEVDTPNLAFTLRRPGEYRITADPDGDFTDIVLRKGAGEVYADGIAYTVDARQPYRFSGTGLRNYQYLAVPPRDEFDRWAAGRDRAYDQSVSARYVSRDVIGYQDLDANGSWRDDPSYGNVWVPNRVVAGWAPYRDGHWAWIAPWGWTWVDDAAWGFAVSHYGRWAHLRDSWAWVPGPVATPAWYAPAVVVFVGGSNFRLTVTSGNTGDRGNSGGIAWFPLAPREFYQPSYAASRAYVTNVNNSNTVVNQTVINNIYNTTHITRVVYANRSVPGAIIAVPTSTFVQSQPVARAAVRATPEMLASAPVGATAPVAPTERSVQGPAGPGNRPPQRVFERPAVMLTAPAATHASFAAQQSQLATQALPTPAAPSPRAAATVPGVPASAPGQRTSEEPRIPRPAAGPMTQRPAPRPQPQPQPQIMPQRPTPATAAVPPRAPPAMAPAAPSVAPARLAAPPVQLQAHPAKPEPTAVAKPPEHRLPVAAPPPAPPQRESQGKPALKGEPHRAQAPPAPDKPREGKKTREEPKREEEQHK